jgi:signal transduction histidine kinase
VRLDDEIRVVGHVRHGTDAGPAATTPSGRNLRVPPGEDADPPPGRLGGAVRPLPSMVVRVRGTKLLVDALIAVVVLTFSLAAIARGGFDDDGQGLDTVAVVLVALTAMPLVGRRVAPLPVFAVVTAATAALYGLRYGLGPPLGFAVALYTVADERPADARLRRAALAASVVVLLGPHLVRDGLAPELFLGAGVWAAAWFAGDRSRLRRERIAELEERARRAERETERERRLAAAEERTRIARDLHDSAGHAINVILVHAGAARLLGNQDPERSHAALETIEEVARETLGEIDQLVRALREDDSPEASDKVEPPPGLAALVTLVERHRSAGLVVSTRARGTRRPLPPGLDQAAYRIVQEALTNAARHGEGSAEVHITFGPSALELEVSNPTRPNANPAAPGHGIVGMRERAALLGGSLDSGARDGAFHVRARLPYGGDGA